MAVIQSGATTDVLTVSPTFKAARVEAKPTEYGAYGHFRYAARTGTLAAALAANALVFAFRWGDASFAAVTGLKVRFLPLTAFTAHQEVSFEAFVGRSYSAAHTGGTAATMTGNSGKGAATMTTSKIATNGDIRTATTAALGGGTITLDAHPFATALGSPLNTNAAAGTAFSPYQLPALDWKADVAAGEHPILLAQNEGIVLRNAIVWPVAGTGVVSVDITWAEVASY